MIKSYRFLLFMIGIPIFFSGCTIEKWVSDIWKDSKILSIGAIIVFIALIIILIRFMIKMKGGNDELAHEEQEFDLDDDLDDEDDEDPNYKTEYLELDSNKTEEGVNIEKPAQEHTISIIIRGEKTGNHNVSYEGTIIGRDPSKADIVVSEAIVSKTHLKITPKDDDFIVEDLNSTNGTFIDSEQITKSVVSPGDNVLLGKKGNILIKFD